MKRKEEKLKKKKVIVYSKSQKTLLAKEQISTNIYRDYTVSITSIQPNTV